MPAEFSWKTERFRTFCIRWRKVSISGRRWGWCSDSTQTEPFLPQAPHRQIQRSLDWDEESVSGKTQPSHPLLNLTWTQTELGFESGESSVSFSSSFPLLISWKNEATPLCYRFSRSIENPAGSVMRKTRDQVFGYLLKLIAPISKPHSVLFELTVMSYFWFVNYLLRYLLQT